MIQEALEQARQLAHENRLEGKDLDELDELEDEEDDAFLDMYRYAHSFDKIVILRVIDLQETRQKRMAEMQSIRTSSVYNQVYPIQKADWSREVTEESKKAYVLVLLTGANDETRLIVELWRTMAAKFGDIKFCQIRGDLAIEGYPDRNTPTLLVYHNGDVKRQIVTLRELGGVKTQAIDLEKMLVDLGAIKLNDSRSTRREELDEQSAKSIFGSRSRQPQVDSDESDLDD